MMQISKTRFIIIIAAAFVGGLLISTMVTFFINGGAKAGIESDSKIQEIQKQIDQVYLNDYDKEELVEGAYNGYVKGLGDPYSDYMTPDEYESWNVSTTGDYSGVGITFTENDKGLYEVISITEGSPAEKAGVKEGDYIISVDGKEYDNSDIMAANMRGEKGTKVKLQISHDGKIKDITLTRDKIIQKSIDYEMLDNKTGYIEIESFISNTAKDFKSAFDDLKKQGAKSLIIDLRNNGGGLVDQSVEIADIFLDEGVVCYVEDKNGNRESYNAEDGKTDLKTVVLVNENSASASEILAAAMKDNGYEIVGKKTFGKGVIQTTAKLGDGSALKLTILQYLSPDEHVIHKKGIKPDYNVTDKEKTKVDEQLEKAKELVK